MLSLPSFFKGVRQMKLFIEQQEMSQALLILLPLSTYCGENTIFWY